MATTIQVSGDLIHTLKEKKLYGKESYEEVIWDLLEDSMEINEQTRRELAHARAEIKAGKVHSFDKVKKELGING